MIVSIDLISAVVASPIPRLEKVRLGKVTKRLTWVLSRSAPDLAVNLVVEVFCDNSILALIIGVTSRADQLLKLNSSYEVLVLRRHQAVAFGQEKDLMVALSSLGVVLKIGLSLLFRQVHKLLRVCDDWLSCRTSRGLLRTWLR